MRGRSSSWSTRAAPAPPSSWPCSRSTWPSSYSTRHARQLRGASRGAGGCSSYVEKQGPPGFGQKAPSRLHQRHRVPGTAPRCGQPRPISLLGRFNAVRPCWPWFSPRCWSAPTTTGWLTRRTGWEAHSSRARTSPCCTTSSPVPWPRARDLACACRGMFVDGYTRVPESAMTKNLPASSMIARPQAGGQPRRRIYSSFVALPGLAMSPSGQLLLMLRFLVANNRQNQELQRVPWVTRLQLAVLCKSASPR